MPDYAIERVYQSSVEQHNALSAAADKDVNQKAMAGFYRDCIIADNIARRDGLERVDFGVVNNAILARWPKGLERIKKMAWKEPEICK